MMTAKILFSKCVKAIMIVIALCCGEFASAESVVLLHTNDTHSMILPDKDGLGGVQRRKVLIDSVRAAEKNVVLIDAGDVVQGTLFFKFFGGDVEYPLMEMLGYDIRVLGNHEFDNGLASLASYYSKTKSVALSANYDFSATALKDVFRPYYIKKIGNHKVGFIGINIDPRSLIVAKNIEGVEFKDVVQTANHYARILKHEKGCDLVVAVTHIGYEKGNEKTTDVELATQSMDIDIIIGAHSHTLIDPLHPEKYPSMLRNREGRKVLVTQCGKSGKYVGYIKVDLDRKDAPYDYRLLRVDDRLDRCHDAKITEFLAPYVHVVDSVNSVPIAYAQTSMSNDSRTGAFPNWTADFAMHFGQNQLDVLRKSGLQDLPEKVDFAIMNVGGIRQPMLEGAVSEGQILSMFPFSNRMVLVKIKGSDLVDLFAAMARKGGEAVSDEVRVVTDDNRKVLNVLVDGEEIDVERIYTICTIDYLAWGNDDLEALARGEIIWSDDEEMSLPMLRYVRWLSANGMPICGDPRSRFIKKMTF